MTQELVGILLAVLLNGIVEIDVMLLAKLA
jgi:hypothetical protein